MLRRTLGDLARGGVVPRENGLAAVLRDLAALHTGFQCAPLAATLSL